MKIYTHLKTWSRQWPCLILDHKLQKPDSNGEKVNYNRSYHPKMFLCHQGPETSHINSELMMNTIPTRGSPKTNLLAPIRIETSTQVKMWIIYKTAITRECMTISFPCINHKMYWHLRLMSLLRFSHLPLFRMDRFKLKDHTTSKTQIQGAMKWKWAVKAN